MGTRTPTRYLTATAVLLALGLPALIGPAVGERMWELTDVVDPAGPYFSWIEPALLYVKLPLAVLGSLVLVMAPGMLFALALGQAFSFELWLLRGFAWSVLILGIVVAAIQGLTDAPLVGPAFCLTAMACSLAAGAFAARRGRTHQLAWPTLDAPAVLSVFVMPLLLLIALTPKFFWESFNGDGAHAFEAARLLLHSPVPFWPGDAGHVTPFPGLNSSLFCYPTAWFIRIFGEYECGARLPYLLFVVLLFAGLRAVAQADRPVRVGGWCTLLIWLSLGSYSLVLAYSATYDPYCADIGLPATQDTLLVACFLGLVVSYLRGESYWTALFASFCLLGSPGGALLVGGWLAALVLASKQREWSRIVNYGALVFGVLVLLAFLPATLELFGLPTPGQEHTTGALLSKFRYVLLGETGRLLWVIVPAGIYPVAIVCSVLRADDGTRALVALWFMTLAMYYFMAFVSLHYFVPAMVLPLAAFWRYHRPEEWASTQPMLLACWFAVVVALGLGTPTGPAIYLGAREVGSQVDSRALPGYDDMSAEYFRGMDLLEHLFVPGWQPAVPSEAYGGSPIAWNFYGQRAPAGARRNYVLLPPHEAPPADSLRVAENEAAVLYVLDEELWKVHRALRPANSNGRSLFAISRDLLFRRPAAFEELPIIDVKAVLGGADDSAER